MKEEIAGTCYLDATIRALKEAGIETIHICPSVIWDNDNSTPRLFMSFKHFDRFMKAIESTGLIKYEIPKT